MLKPAIVATVLFALAGAPLVYAQQGGFGGHRGFGDYAARAQMWHHLSTADVNAFADARIAALKAGLELTPDQAKNWPPFEQAVRELVQLRVQRIEAWQSGQQQPPASPFERLARRADTMAKTSAALKKIADAGAPLYASLNDDQKGRFMKLARILRPHPGMWRHGGRFGERHGWNPDHQFGRDNQDDHD